MLNYLISFDIGTLNMASTIISIILAIIAIFFTLYNSMQTNEELTKDYQEKVETIAKSLSTQIKLGDEKETNTSFKSGHSDLIASITVAPKLEKSNDEKIIELAVHETFMKAHQNQAIKHSRIQFYTGLLMSITGFLLIIYVVAFALSSNGVTNVITIAGSIIIEGTSILFLKESHKLRQSAKEYHDNLSENKKQLQAIKIAESIENTEIRSAIKAQLALHMIGIHSENIDTAKILEVLDKE